MAKKSIIYLIGFMGAGKSFVARNLQRLLQWESIDLDKYIEAEEGRLIREIFNQEGQDRFREMERDSLKKISEHNDKLVISTGGGTPCFYQNMDFMNQKGFTIYISKSHEQLLANLRRGMQKRPLIADMTIDELKSFIREKLLERNKFYSKAQWKVHGYEDQALIDVIFDKVKQEFNPTMPQ